MRRQMDNWANVDNIQIYYTYSHNDKHHTLRFQRNEMNKRTKTTQRDSKLRNQT
jgi:hypothetical protein